MTRLHTIHKLLATWLLTGLAASGAWAQASELSSGEVRKVDKTANKITLKHGEIKNLEMPPMTMVFQVRDPALLDKAKVGDKVRFAAEQKEGALVVTALEAAP
ncbi:copper-binding protein [uncultured Rhodoferax sp.]|uniref:copper-binding protein n=1 Tax=uncultured Rhodoferax sp. TaxID=223188 RepID=UPI0025E753B2|nr:copper-binding protein [uncultured Rhodoferax sp.]